MPQPGVFAISRSLKLRSCFEVKRRVALVIFATVDDTTIANVNVHAIIRLDAVNRFKFRAIQSLVSQLIVSASVDDRSLDGWSLEGSASNGNDGALAVLGIATGIGFAQRHLQLQSELELRRVLGFSNLGAGRH